ncbi:hypothetical protein JHK87_015954 [Glycine soja]|nr:hypothetical protein JHK87_015954 [Glycine soja]
MDWVSKTIKPMQFRQNLTELISVGLIVSFTLVMWKGLMCVTGSGTPVVVVISGSMEPGFRRGDILFLHMSKDPIRAGDIVVYNLDVCIIPHYNFVFYWL